MRFFSRIHVNSQTRGGRKLLSNRQAMHAAVESAFPPGALTATTGRVLWRLDQMQKQYTLYVVSPRKPDFTHIVEQAGWAGQEWDVAEYDKFLSRLREGQSWIFRITANPVISRSQGQGKRGKVIPLASVESQVNWLMSRSGSHGFSFNDSGENLLATNLVISSRQDLHFSKNAQHQHNRKTRSVSLRLVQFDGNLVIEDLELFRSMLVNGLGKGKAYGAGLMTLKPTNS